MSHVLLQGMQRKNQSTFATPVLILGEAEVLFDFSQAFVKRRWSHFSGRLRQVVSCFVRLWAGVVHCFILRFLRSVTDSCLLFA